MGLRDRLDSLPIDRIRKRTPSVWEPADDEGEATPTGEGPATARDDPAGGGPEADTPASRTAGAVAGADASTLPGEAAAEDGGNRIRKVLLGVSLGSGVLAVVSAVVWRVLGRGDDDEGPADAAEPPAPEPPASEPPATPEPERDEGAAALIGLGFAAGVAALRRRLSSPTK